MNRRKYERPVIKTEKMFEKTVLACAKCPGSSNSPSHCGSSQHV